MDFVLSALAWLREFGVLGWIRGRFVSRGNPLYDKLAHEARRWADRLPPPYSSLDWRALLGELLSPKEATSLTPGSREVGEKLRHSEVPSERLWSQALQEQWERVSGTLPSDETHPFFAAALENVLPYLNELANRLERAASQEEGAFRHTAYKQLQPNDRSASSIDVDRDRFLGGVVAEFKRELRLSEFIPLRVIPYATGEKSKPQPHKSGEEPSEGEAQTREAKSFDELAEEGSVLVVGPPGSGKTSALKRLLLRLAEEARHDERAPLPVYLEWADGSFLEQIRRTLHRHGLCDSYDTLDEAWVRDALQRGEFILLVDDVHHVTGNDEALRQSGLLDLLGYNSTRCLLMSRDTGAHGRLGLPPYKPAPLDREEALQVLSLHSGEDDAHRMLYALWKDEPSRSLYSTPQMLRFAAEVYEPKSDVFRNKTLLFERYLERRHEKEKTLSAEALPLDLKQGLLASLAYALLTDKQAPSSHGTADRRLLTRVANEKRQELGYDDRSTADVIDRLLAEGYLVRRGQAIRFEHDQWLEFFAARALFERGETIHVLRTEPSSRAEVARFVAGCYTPQSARERLDFWHRFWEDLAMLDFFALQPCLNVRRGTMLGNWKAAFEGFAREEEDVLRAFADVLRLYVGLAEHHFPLLQGLIQPQTEGDVGIVVDTNSFYYGYRKLPPGAEVVARFNSARVAEERGTTARSVFLKLFGELGVEEGVHYYYRPAPVQESPALFAFKDLKSQLLALAEKGRLPEPTETVHERIYTEALAFSSRQLRGRRSSRRLRLEDMLETEALLDSLREMQTRRFGAWTEIDGGDDHMRMLRDRRVYAADFESDLRAFLQAHPDLALPQVKEPFPELGEVFERNLWRDDPLDEEDRASLIAFSPTFYYQVYACYKRMVETCFPTATQSFELCSRFPIRIVLAEDDLDNRKIFGKRTLYAMPPQIQKEPIQVELVKMNTDRARELERELEGYGWVWWRWDFKSFQRVEPLRNAVYGLLRRDLEKLIGRS